MIFVDYKFLYPPETTNGYIDFPLLDSNESPLMVLEAKSEDKDP